MIFNYRDKENTLVRVSRRSLKRSSHRFPMTGRGAGPGGSRRRSRCSLRSCQASRATTRARRHPAVPTSSPKLQLLMLVWSWAGEFASTAVKLFLKSVCLIHPSLRDHLQFPKLESSENRNTLSRGVGQATPPLLSDL